MIKQQILMAYYSWRCRKCRKGEHEWKPFARYPIDGLDPIYTESCARPSCTAIR